MSGSSFLQNSLNNIFSNITETNTELPQWINIIDKKKSDSKSAFINSSKTKKQQGGSIDSATSSAFMGQMGGAVDSATSSEFFSLHGGSKSRKQQGGSIDSATSSAFMGQMGGAVDSATSSAFMGQMGGAVDSATSSAFMGQMGGAVDSATSTAFMGQMGGTKTKKQQGGNNKDINKLVSMLTSDSNNNLSNTDTETLEAQLRDILNQNGGSKKNNNDEINSENLEEHLRKILLQDGGSKKNKQQTAGSNNLNGENIRNFFTSLKSQGVKVDVKLNDKTLSEFFDLAQNTTTDISEHNLKGGAKKNSKKASKLIDGGANAGFQAFGDFKKYVSTKLKIPNGVPAVKIAASVNRKMKEQHPNLSPTDLSKKNMEYFDKNIDKIKSEFKELIEKSSK